MKVHEFIGSYQGKRYIFNRQGIIDRFGNKVSVDERALDFLKMISQLKSQGSFFVDFGKDCAFTRIGDMVMQIEK